MRTALSCSLPKVRLSLVTAVPLLVLFAVAIHVGRAAGPIRVTTSNDTVNTDGYCSLREAIIAANKDQAGSGQSGECAAGSGADTIIIPAGTYTLARTDNGKEDSSSTGDLDNLASVTISPTGPVTITAISGLSDRIFHVLGGNVTILNATITRGKVTGYGGAIFVASAASLKLENATLTDNTATERGGGIYNAGTLSLINDTISGNRVTRSGAGYGGGGLYQGGGTASVLNVTIANNTGSSGGNVNVAKGAFSLKNTLITNSSSGNCAGTFTSAGYNLSSDATCVNSLNQTGDRNGVDPQIGPLHDNGGWTLTHALPRDSQAVDDGTMNGCPATDQRGQARRSPADRPIGLSCDIGAYENQDPIQHGPIFTINQPGDADDGACTTLDCKLREAINAANAQPNGGVPDQVHFDLPGDGIKAYASILFGQSGEETRYIGKRCLKMGYEAVKFGWEPMGQSEAVDIDLVRGARAGLGDGSTLPVVLGIAPLRPGESARNVPANLTVVREGSGQFYSTQGDGKCALDEVRQAPVDDEPRTWRLEGRGFCTQPARALSGDGSVLLTWFDVVALVTDTRPPPPGTETAQ